MSDQKLLKLKSARVDEEYIAQNVEGMKKAAYWKDQKRRIEKFDSVYGGALGGLTPDESTSDEPTVENRLKNSAHDIKRLSREARGYPVFTKEGEDDKSATRAKVRAAITETVWEEGGGADMEGLLYFDLIRGGFAAVAVYVDKDESDYPLFLHLDPQYGYPTVINGKLVDYMHIQTMKEREAAALFPNTNLNGDPKNSRNVDVILYFNKETSLQAIVQTTQDDKTRATILSEWKHGLGRVPVGFKALETADGQFRGLLDQLSGPLKARNRATKLMIDYLDDMVHAPYEERGILNDDALPGADTIYHHDPDAERETFMRRVAPAAPAGAVFGLLQYMDAQEQSEGYQPPSRVGNVTQSIATGSFVEATQGSLSSVVLEMQGYVAVLRKQLNTVAMKVDEKFLNKEKPLMRSIGQQNTYTPSKDIKGWYYHKVVFGAAAGLDRAQADSRVLQHLGAGLIDDSVARDQIDYIESDTNLKDDVDRMLLRKVQFQKLINDPRVSFRALAQIEIAMSKGKTRIEAVEEVLPELMEEERAQAQAAAQGPGGGEASAAPEGVGPEEEAAALEAGATPGADALEMADFASEPMLQVFSSQPR